MNAKVLKIAKIAVSVIGMGVTLASAYLSEKDLDERVSKEVLKALKENKES